MSTASVGRQAHIYAWYDTYGRIVAVRTSFRELDESDSPSRVAKGYKMAVVPPGIAREVEKTPNGWGYGEAGWRQRIKLGFGVSGAQAYANGIDVLEILVTGVPDGVDRVRLQKDRQEMWLSRGPDNLFLLRLRSTAPTRSSFELVDARFWAPYPSAAVQFIAPPQAEEVTTDA